MIKKTINKAKKFFYFYNLFDRDLTTLFRFIKLNFFSPNVRRYGHVFFYPYKDVALKLSQSAVIELYGDFHIGKPTINKHGQYSRLLMGDFSRITVNKRCVIPEGCDLQILNNGTLTVDAFHSNINLEVLCGNQIRLLGDVYAGRHVRLKDYNGHEVSCEEYPFKKPIVIEEHVWLCTGSTINPGSYIESGTVVSDNSTVTGYIPANSFVHGNPAKVAEDNIIFQI